jgi:hypothetical protein
MTSEILHLATVHMCILALNGSLNIVPAPSVMYLYCVKVYVLVNVTLSRDFSFYLQKHFLMSPTFYDHRTESHPILMLVVFELISHGEPKILFQ